MRSTTDQVKNSHIWGTIVLFMYMYKYIFLYTKPQPERTSNSQSQITNPFFEGVFASDAQKKQHSFHTQQYNSRSRSFSSVCNSHADSNEH